MIKTRVSARTYQVPDIRRQPVDVWADTADQVQMLGFAVSLVDQIDNETGGNKGEGEHHTDSHQHVYYTIEAGKAK